MYYLADRDTAQGTVWAPFKTSDAIFFIATGCAITFGDVATKVMLQGYSIRSEVDDEESRTKDQLTVKR